MGQQSTLAYRCRRAPRISIEHLGYRCSAGMAKLGHGPASSAFCRTSNLVATTRVAIGYPLSDTIAAGGVDTGTTRAKSIIRILFLSLGPERLVVRLAFGAVGHLPAACSSLSAADEDVIQRTRLPSRAGKAGCRFFLIVRDRDPGAQRRLFTALASAWLDWQTRGLAIHG